MRKPDFTHQLDRGGAVCVLLTMADRKRRPLTHAIRGQNCRASCWRDQECRRGVRLMVLSKKDLVSGNTQARRDDATHPDLLAERILHGLWKRSPGVRESSQGTGENPIELQHRPFVEDH